MVHSRPYHPQSQGKIEISYRALRSKMKYYFLKMGEKGLTWTEALPEYQKMFNEEPKDVLKYKSPFEVCFARKPSSHTNRAMESEDLQNR